MYDLSLSRDPWGYHYTGNMRKIKDPLPPLQYFYSRDVLSSTVNSISLYNFVFPRFRWKRGPMWFIGSDDLIPYLDLYQQLIRTTRFCFFFSLLIPLCYFYLWAFPLIYAKHCLFAAWFLVFAFNLFLRV